MRKSKPIVIKSEELYWPENEEDYEYTPRTYRWYDVAPFPKMEVRGILHNAMTSVDDKWKNIPIEDGISFAGYTYDCIFQMSLAWNAWFNGNGLGSKGYNYLAHWTKTPAKVFRDYEKDLRKYRQELFFVAKRHYDGSKRRWTPNTKAYESRSEFDIDPFKNIIYDDIVDRVLRDDIEYFKTHKPDHKYQPGSYEWMIEDYSRMYENKTLNNIFSGVSFREKDRYSGPEK